MLAISSRHARSEEEVWEPVTGRSMSGHRSAGAGAGGAPAGADVVAAGPAPVLVTTKPGEDKGWVALRLQNLTGEQQAQTVSFTGHPAAARAADPIEHPGDSLQLDGQILTVELAPLEIRTVLVRFAH